MTTEQKFLEIAKIPNHVWETYGFILSESGQFIWFGSPNLSTLATSGVLNIVVLDTYMLIEFSHSRIYIGTTKHSIQSTHYS